MAWRVLVELALSSPTVVLEAVVETSVWQWCSWSSTTWSSCWRPSSASWSPLDSVAFVGVVLYNLVVVLKVFGFVVAIGFIAVNLVVLLALLIRPSLSLLVLALVSLVYLCIGCCWRSRRR